MSHRYTFFEESNAIEDVYSDEAVEANIDACRYLRQEQEITEETVKKVHEIIMKQFNEEVSGDKKEKIRPGQYKDVKNFVISGRGKKVFCPPEKVEEKMQALLNITPQTGEEVIQWHATFESIPPFRDGNGRVGRVLMYYHFREVLDQHPVVFHAGTRQGYYDLIDSCEMLVDPEMTEKPLI